MDPQPTAAEQIAKNGGLEYTSAASYPGFKPPHPLPLPSGAVFLVQKPQLQKLIRKGQIPNPLMDVVNKVFNERDARELIAEAEAKGVTVEQIQTEREQEQDEPPAIPEEPPELGAEGVFHFRDVLVWAAIVAPTVEMEPPVGGTPLTENGHLAYEALDDDDVMAILNWVNEETAQAERFRAEQRRTHGGGDSGTVRPEAERSALDPA